MIIHLRTNPRKYVKLVLYALAPQCYKQVSVAPHLSSTALNHWLQCIFLYTMSAILILTTFIFSKFVFVIIISVINVFNHTIYQNFK